MRFRYLPVVAVLAVAALAGCSSAQPAAPAPVTQPPSTATSTPTTTVDASADLQAAVRAYSAAYLGGKGEAYDLLSQRCKERMTRAAFLQLVTAASQQYGPQEIASLKVDQVAGDLGRVTYTYAKSELDQRGEPWVRENGAWRVDDC